MSSRWIEHKSPAIPDAVYYAELRKRHAYEFWLGRTPTRWNRFVGWLLGHKR